jgi:hypothetical protein
MKILNNESHAVTQVLRRRFLTAQAWTISQGFYVGSLVDKVTLKCVLLRAFQVSPASALYSSVSVVLEVPDQSASITTSVLRWGIASYLSHG